MTGPGDTRGRGEPDRPDEVNRGGPATGPVDEITEVEAEVEAELPGVDADGALLPHLGARRASVAPDTVGAGPPPNPRADRQRFLVVYLWVALVLAFAIGVLELVLPEDLRDEAATVMVVVFVVAPVGRIIWLMVRWTRRGDWRFAAVGAALLAVVATGFLVR